MVKQENNIDFILNDYKIVLGKDFNTYKNHIYRIYNYMILLDQIEDNHEKYAIAAVFHDLGIWTHSFNYLKPSIQLAKKHLLAINRENWLEEISLMIDYHHKMSTYKGKYSITVETFRKADWIDVSMGFKMMTLNKNHFKSIKTQFPLNGFHWFLVKQSFKYFLKHPLKPLPMFKK